MCRYSNNDFFSIDIIFLATSILVAIYQYSYCFNFNFCAVEVHRN